MYESEELKKCISLHFIDKSEVVPTVQWTMMDSLRIPTCD